MLSLKKIQDDFSIENRYHLEISFFCLNVSNLIQHGGESTKLLSSNDISPSWHGANV